MMKFKDIQEGKLYQSGDNANVYTKKDGLLYQVGILFELKGIREGLELNMYYCEYSPNFILGMEFWEIKLGRM